MYKILRTRAGVPAYLLDWDGYLIAAWTAERDLALTFSAIGHAEDGVRFLMMHQPTAKDGEETTYKII